MIRFVVLRGGCGDKDNPGQTVEYDSFTTMHLKALAKAFRKPRDRFGAGRLTLGDDLEISLDDEVCIPLSGSNALPIARESEAD